MGRFQKPILKYKENEDVSVFVLTWTFSQYYAMTLDFRSSFNFSIGSILLIPVCF